MNINNYLGITLLNISKRLIKIPTFYKKLIVLSIDIILCVLSFFISVYVRIGSFDQFHFNYFIVIIISILLMVLIFFRLNMYSIIFRFYDHRALKLSIKSVFIYSIIFCSIIFFLELENIPRTLSVIQPLILLTLLYIFRSTLSLFINFILSIRKKKFQFKNIIIYGSGVAGQGLANNFYLDPLNKIIGFYDDDKNKQGRYLVAFKIYNQIEFEALINNKMIDEVWLAIPSLSASKKEKIIDYLKELNITIKILPDLNNLKNDNVQIKDLRSLNLSELIGRIEHKNNVVLDQTLQNKSIYVTGAGGTIGSNLCFKLIKSNPKHLILFDKNELNLYTIHSELDQIINTDKSLKTKLVPVLGSINDIKLLQNIFSKWKCDILYNAAAYKHVPLVEENLLFALRNNVFGTLNLIKTANRFNIRKFIHVSTDKAVKPTNIMGVSKRICELILSSYAENSKKTLFSVVRFGNVIGSSGSVIPKFIKQIQNGGPVTLTHKNITRFFMSVEEATDLVIEAGNISVGKETFLLDMGAPVKVYDLIIKIIKINGLELKNDQNPNGDIEIQIIGMRPGEKLYEELLLSDKQYKTSNPKIYKGFEPYIKRENLMKLLKELKTMIDKNDEKNVLKTLKKLVPEYKFANKKMLN